MDHPGDTPLGMLAKVFPKTTSWEQKPFPPSKQLFPMDYPDIVCSEEKAARARSFPSFWVCLLLVLLLQSSASLRVWLALLGLPVFSPYQALSKELSSLQKQPETAEASSFVDWIATRFSASSASEAIAGLPSYYYRTNVENNLLYVHRTHTDVIYTQVDILMVLVP